MIKKASKAEKCHNEIIETIVKYRLNAFEIITVLELIKLDGLEQFRNKVYFPVSFQKPRPIGKKIPIAIIPQKPKRK